MKRVSGVLGCILATSAGAQQSSQAKIPILSVAPPDARTHEPLKSVRAVAFDNGSVLINDGAAQRLLFFAPTLDSYRVTADTMGAGAPPYPSSSPYVFKYIGDSAVLGDMLTSLFIIIGPDGTLGRAMAHARPDMYHALSGQPATFDAKGHFLYTIGGNLVRDAAAGRTLDTSVVVRADFDTRTVDTLLTITKQAASLAEIFKDENGKVAAERLINLVPPQPDQWTVTSDGSLAIVRTHDYHIAWKYADGTSASTPKVPFDWRRLTDADKLAKIDSARRIVDSLNTTAHPYSQPSYSCTPGPRGEAKEDWDRRCLAERASGKSKIESVIAKIIFSPPSEMLDYVPPIGPGGIKADRDNHLWILPSTTLSAVGGGLLYDVVNTKGEVFERVHLPAGRSIAAFGPNGAIYLLSGDPSTGFTLERTHVVRR